MYTIEYYQLFILIFLLFFNKITMIHSSHDDNHVFEIIYRFENDDVNFQCDLMDVAWWKRPNLLATRSGTILPKFRSKISLERINHKPDLQKLNIRQLQSNDSGVYECETLGDIRQFNLIIMVRITTVEFGAQLISTHDSINDYISNQTDHNLPHQSLRSSNGSIHLREHQLIRLTCVVSRAQPAAILHFPFDIEYHIERNSTIENDDHTYRTILVLILRIHRYYHNRIFHCEANQILDYNDHQHERNRILSNILHMDVAYSPICSRKIASSLPEYLTGLRRSINITCYMHNGNPSKINFTWHLPNGNKRIGHYLNKTSNYITVKPTNLTDFGQITCRAQNELGLFGECHFNMVLGGIPDPIQSCHYTYLNSTLTVNCLAGFHQGDEDFFCYMYKRQQNGSFSEHARLKGNCAFILPDLKPDYHHDFRVFTKNKFGDNYDRSYTIQVGKAKTESFAEKTGIQWPYMVLLIIGACIAALVLICCACHRIRKTMYYKRKAEDNCENLTYRNHDSPTHSYSQTNGGNSLVHVKQNGNGITYPVRPYRSKDYLVSSESSGPHRNHIPFKPISSPDEETSSNRQSLFKETDLDHIVNVSNERPDATFSNMRTLLINRNRSTYNPYDSKADSNPYPVTIQRRSSFQVATQLNSLDFSPTPESFYFLDKQLIKPTQRNHYSPERDLRERENYREKRRDSSSYSKIDFNRQSTLVMENQMLKDEHNDKKWSEMNLSNEYNRDISKDDKNFILNNDDRYRDDGIFV